MSNTTQAPQIPVKVDLRKVNTPERLERLARAREIRARNRIAKEEKRMELAKQMILASAGHPDTKPKPEEKKTEMASAKRRDDTRDAPKIRGGQCTCDETSEGAPNTTGGIGIGDIRPTTDKESQKIKGRGCKAKKVNEQTITIINGYFRPCPQKTEAGKACGLFHRGIVGERCRA